MAGWGNKDTDISGLKSLICCSSATTVKEGREDERTYMCIRRSPLCTSTLSDPWWEEKTIGIPLETGNQHCHDLPSTN